MDAETIAAALGRHTPKAGGGFMACCPAHDDRDPSLSLDEKNGKLLYRCMAGCTQGKVLEALKSRGLWGDAGNSLPPAPRRLAAPPWRPITPIPANAPPPPAAHPKLGKPFASWKYPNQAGELLQIVHRFDTPDGKQVLPMCYATDGTRSSWRWMALPEPRPLYAAPGLGKAGVVVVVEGEKAADAARRLTPGLAVVTWMGGCNAVLKADWSPLAGKIVLVWPDADGPGYKAALAVAGELARVGAKSVCIVEPPTGADEGWDLADAEAEGWTKDLVNKLLRAALSVDEFRAKYQPGPGDDKPPVAEDEPTRSRLGVVMHRACDIAVQAIRWLWLHWLALGKLHIVAGQAGTGKTSLVLALLATITTGRRWPDGAPGTEPAHVLIWSAEDGAADTLVPRLMAAGADLSRVHIIAGVRAEGSSRSFDPSVDLDHLLPAIRELRPAALMVDPIVSAVAGDSHKNAETRRGLQPLVDLAEQFDMAVIGISHFSKGTTGREPMERVTGSLAFAALARVVLAAAKLPEDNPHGCERILARAKSNIGPDDGAIGYRLAVTVVAPGIEVGMVEWQNVIDGSARELLAEPAAEEEGGAIGEARAFLEDFLTHGPKPVSEILTAAKRAGVSERTLKRAKAVIGAKASKPGLHTGWQWALPTVPTNPEECHHKTLASFEQFEECQQIEVALLGEGGPLHTETGGDDLPSFDF